MHLHSCANWTMFAQEAKSAKLGCEIKIEASWSTNSSTIPLYNSESTFSIRGNVANQKTIPRFIPDSRESMGVAGSILSHDAIV